MRIVCNKCKELVDHVEVKKVDEGHFIEVHCHGEKDSMTLTNQFLQENPGLDVAIQSGQVPGIAFKE